MTMYTMGEALVNSYLYGKTPRDQIFNAGMFRTPAAPYSRGHSEVGLSHWTTPYFLWPDKVKDDPLGVLFKVFRALTCFLVINYLVNFTFCLFFCVRAYAGHLCRGACMKVRGQLVGVILSLHSVGSGDGRTSGGHPLSHLIGP